MDAAYAYQRALDAREKIVVGVNEFVDEIEQPIETLYIDDAVEDEQKRGRGRPCAAPATAGGHVGPRRAPAGLRRTKERHAAAHRGRQDVRHGRRDLRRHAGGLRDVRGAGRFLRRRRLRRRHDPPLAPASRSREGARPPGDRSPLRSRGAQPPPSVTSGDFAPAREDGERREKMTVYDRNSLFLHRAGRRGPARGQVRRRRGRRGPRERGRSGPRGPEGDSRGDQLHGAGGPRAHLPRPDRGALRRARIAADGHGEHVELRHRVHGLDRGAGPDDHGHLGRGPRGDGVDGDRSGDAPVGPEPAGPHVSPAGPAGRRVEARRPDRSLRGPRADRGPRPVGRSLRDHERGRHDGAGAGPREVLREARPRDGHGRGPHPLPAEDRAARPSDRLAASAHAPRRIPALRLPERSDAGGASRARPRRHPGGRARRSCASTPSA